MRRSLPSSLLPRRSYLLGGLLLFALLYAALAAPKYFGSNTTFHPVTTTADSGPGSLRAAIEASADGHVIYFVPALTGATISLTSGELVIDASITISARSMFLTVARDPQASAFRIFHVLPGHSCFIEGLTIRGGGGVHGAGILNDHSSLSLSDCTIREGSVGTNFGYGGGIYNDGSGGSATLTMIDCSITGNNVATAGGGIYNDASSGGSATVSMWNSSVTNNTASYFNIPAGSGDAGGIANSGVGASMTLTNCTVTNNYAGLQFPFPVGNGGGINNSGTLTIIGSTINNNQGYGEGGGIYNVGTLAVISSSVSGNGASGQHDGVGWGDGGGILNNGTLTIKNSTLSNNYAAENGGGIRGGGTITNSTISDNWAGNEGGGIFTTGVLTIGNTILKAGTSGANISGSPGTVTSRGYNLSSDDGGGFLTAAGDQINTDPVLGPLQDNGGPTFTHEPLNGSPAIDAGDPNFTPPPFEDQRGYPRVFNGRVDIGSLEVQPVSTPSPSPTPSPTPCGLIFTFSENFDGVTAPALPPGWTSSFTSGPANCTPTDTCALGTDWATSITAPFSPPHSAFHNAPGCVTDSVLDTPPFTPGPTNGVHLIFQHSFDLEDGRDGAVLEISIEDGPFVDFASIGGHPGYNGTIASDSLSPLAGRAAWTGNSGGYQQAFIHFPTAALSHHFVRLRFRLATDCSGAGAGWRIDNIVVVDNIGCPSPTVPPPPPTPTATATATATGTPTPTATASPPSPTPTATPSPNPARALNISTRMLVQTGDGVGIGGFIITGSVAKQVTVRGIGPSLADSGVPNPLADPILELHGPSGFVTITNDNWTDSQDQCLETLELRPTHVLESALCGLTLDPGAYTAILRGKNNGTGIGLVEVYDLGPAASKLANISTRAFVGTGANVMIGGFILGGDDNSQIEVFGIGPSLAASGVSGVLADPTLELRDSNGVLLASNDNCEASNHPLDPAEACIQVSLPPGLFTALLAGKNGGTGIGLVEIYHMQ